MPSNIAYAIALLLVTALIHLAATAMVLGAVRRLHSHHWAAGSSLRRATVLSGVVLALALAAYVESAVWAGFYVGVGALGDFPEAMYFSLVTFTTLGYGDVTLDTDWRTLAAFQAANGILMFGWSTALLVATATRLVDIARHDRSA